MTDAITVLTTDHRELDILFTKVEGTPNPPKDIVDEIVKKLSIHDAIERELLYPALRDKVDGGAGMADHAVEEHNEAATDLLAIDKADSESPEQAELLSKLIQEVRHHVKEEEEKLFPAMRSSMSSDELEALGGKLETAKKTAPTRPHPHAPNEGLGTMAAGAMAAPVDKIRDAVEGRG